MSYQDYDAADFAADASFQSWVQRTDEAAARFWEQYAAAHPDKREVLREAQMMVRSLRFHAIEVDPADMDAVKAAIDGVLDTEDRKKNRHSLVRRMLIGTAAAAAVIAAVLVMRGPAEADMLTLRTGFGETTTLKLHDGTEVWLNANSSIRYPLRWKSGDVRRVELQGEAFFKVKHAPQGLHPRFVVHTALTDVEVTGTAFNVYHRHDSAAIALEEGSVTAGGKHMQPGDLLQQSALGTSLIQSPDGGFSSWMKKRVVIRDGTLATVALRMEDIYGRRVRFGKPSLASLPFTGSAAMDQPELLLKAVCTVHNLKMREENDTIILE
ncbi:FecR family protein [Chitinophaga sp.]|uniref:FecR family protein n=1 Tax=Chitinophaga sp. TaxID=1869181 RepID=UPI00262D5C9D|nr:FecR domain-containing protein [uncultured Chitinophaga sp.]